MGVCAPEVQWRWQNVSRQEALDRVEQLSSPLFVSVLSEESAHVPREIWIEAAYDTLISKLIRCELDGMTIKWRHCWA